MPAAPGCFQRIPARQKRCFISVLQAVNGVSTLKSLIDQFAAESAPDARKVLTTQIIYAWTGVTDKDPLSRGYYIGDGRKLYAMEALLGESFVGVNGANPYAGASDQLNAAFKG